MARLPGAQPPCRASERRDGACVQAGGCSSHLQTPGLLGLLLVASGGQVAVRIPKLAHGPICSDTGKLWITLGYKPLSFSLSMTRTCRAPTSAADFALRYRGAPLSLAATPRAGSPVFRKRRRDDSISAWAVLQSPGLWDRGPALSSQEVQPVGECQAILFRLISQLRSPAPPAAPRGLLRNGAKQVLEVRLRRLNLNRSRRIPPVAPFRRCTIRGYAETARVPEQINTPYP
ncbi:hypothetical protein AAFF_G00217840 [Aldrovandia affinis]|uniref:Uncharacterized protein n=1 Tax=Aldrovandia affinis TaxID=143900 RepID=A0AAD7WUR5_9TELE|nr:hypothetical protein AAFF_G00217840 [Aldrovandia affinis]